MFSQYPFCDCLLPCLCLACAYFAFWQKSLTPDHLQLADCMYLPSAQIVNHFQFNLTLYGVNYPTQLDVCKFNEHAVL